MEYKKIIITGASSGIGECLANALASENHSLVLTGRNEKKLEIIAKRLTPLCKELVAIPADLSKQKDLGLFTGASVIINSAAYFGPPINLLNTSRKDILYAFETNVLAPVGLAQLSLNYMLSNGYGRIINVGSRAGLTGYPLRTPYCLSKHALIAFTKTLNGELGSGEYGVKTDVKAFCLCPGPVKGERIEKLIRERAEYKGVPIKEMRKNFEKLIGQMLDPQEIVDKIIELLEPGNKFKRQDVIVF